MNNFDIVKPTTMNLLFKKYGTAKNPLYEISIGNIKRDINDNYIQKRIDALRLLPITNKQRATIKGQITRRFKKLSKIVSDYEKKNGEVEVPEPQTEYIHYESNWLK